MKGESIILQQGGRCREDMNPSAWEQFTFSSVIVPDKCDTEAEKQNQKTLELPAPQGRHNNYNDCHFNALTKKHSSLKTITYPVQQPLKGWEKVSDYFLGL